MSDVILTTSLFKVAALICFLSSSMYTRYRSPSGSCQMLQSLASASVTSAAPKHPSQASKHDDDGLEQAARTLGFQEVQGRQDLLEVLGVGGLVEHEVVDRVDVLDGIAQVVHEATLVLRQSRGID